MTHATILGPPHASGHEPTTGAVQQRNLELARRAGWLEVDPDDLDFKRYWVEHRLSGRLYCLRRGETDAAVYTSAAAFYLTDIGEIRFLEDPPAGSPQTMAELEQRQAEREARRNPSPKSKPKPRWKR